MEIWLKTCSQLSSPPEGFEEAVKAHFYLKRQQLIKARYQIIKRSFWSRRDVYCYDINMLQYVFRTGF